MNTWPLKMPAQLPARLRLSDLERTTLAEIGKRLGRKRLDQVACVAKPDTILAWYRNLIAQKFDGSKRRAIPPGRRIDPKLEALIIRMVQENSSWGYDCIAGALANLGYHVSDQTVRNVLERHGLAPAPKRSQNTTWKEFIRGHMTVMAGIDFFTVEVLTWRGLVTYYILYFIPGESAGLSGGDHAAPGPRLDGADGPKCDRQSRGHLNQRRYVLHDRDTKFCASFLMTLASGGIESFQIESPSIT